MRFGKILPVNRSGASVNDESAISRSRILQENLTLSIFGMSWWDEKHIEQLVGEIKEKKYQFACGEDGVYDKSVELEKKMW